MRRRKFIATSLAASALAVGDSASLRAGTSGGTTGQATSSEKGREYYQLRRYELRNGPQVKLVNAFFQEAFIPGANRLGVKPVGAFTVVAGAQSPSVYVLIPSSSLDTLVQIDARLASDADYTKAGAAFLQAPA